MSNEIKIIDLFAGPGGLGEGFSALRDAKGKPVFRIGVSIEKEASAHQTLRLRAFYRQFEDKKVPAEYYEYLEGKLGKYPDDQLFKNPKFQKEVEAANSEARMLELGAENAEIDRSIKKALGSKPGNWVLIGGPPCQAYSLAGRSRNMGIKDYKIEDDHRSTLYKEYLRVINEFSPAVFVMENVKGLLSAKHNGESIFDHILEDLSDPGMALDGKSKRSKKHQYDIHSLVPQKPDQEQATGNLDPRQYLIKSEQYGVPQARHRVILLGIRRDLAQSVTPGTLKQVPAPTLEKIIGDLPPLRSGLSKGPDSFEGWSTTIQEHSHRVIKAVNKTMPDVARSMATAVEEISDKKLNRRFSPDKAIPTRKSPKALTDWYRDPTGWKKIANHETRGHIPGDLMRYLFCAAYAETRKGPERRTPKANEFPSTLAPKHENWDSGKFADRFRVQAADQTATTVTSHISKDGHYFIHYDPRQCRSLTVREAARIQTFPDNYFFVGNRTQQYVQVGNAVPPYLANQIAKLVAEFMLA